MVHFRNLGRRGALAGALVGGFVFGGIGFGSITMASAAPPAKEVIVTNSAAKPVPVSVQGTAQVAGTVIVGNLPATQQVGGTVNVGNLPATQQVGGTVNVGNLPAVQKVQVSQDTAVLAQLEGASVPASTPIYYDPGVHSFNATGYGTVRVSVGAACSAPLTFNLSQADSSGSNLVTLLDKVEVPCVGSGFSKSYDVPGQMILFSFGNSSPDQATVWVEVWGRP